MKEIAELKAKLGQNSRNSSMPPSSDPSWKATVRKAGPSGRNRGGQPGHRGHKRELLPPERVVAVHEVKPAQCKRCAGALGGEDPAPWIHQEVEIPPLVAQAQEYRMHRLRCVRCGTQTRAKLPEGVAAHGIGARLQGILALLAGRYLVSKRDIVELAQDVFEVKLSLGGVSQLEGATSEAVANAVQEAVSHVQQAGVVNADETSWRTSMKKTWLWLAATARVAVFQIHATRSRAAALGLLGLKFAGYLISDRYNAYLFVDVTKRQLCWAHLMRHFEGFTERGTEARTLGLELLGRTRTMFRLWHRVRDGTLSRASFVRRMVPVRHRILELLGQGVHVATSERVASQCYELHKLPEALFTFVDVEGIEPTNNHAERLVRRGVLWRKRSLGTDSARGNLFVGRMLTVGMSLGV